MLLKFVFSTVAFFVFCATSFAQGPGGPGGLLPACFEEQTSVCFPAWAEFAMLTQPCTGGTCSLKRVIEYNDAGDPIGEHYELRCSRTGVDIIAPDNTYKHAEQTDGAGQLHDWPIGEKTCLYRRLCVCTDAINPCGYGIVIPMFKKAETTPMGPACSGQ